MTVTPQTNATFAQIADVLRSSDDIVICGHVSPDGDCIGSALALWHALGKLGKRATCLLVKNEPISDDLAFLPGSELMVPAEAYDGPASVFVGVDVPTRERVGEAACKILDACDTSITIDHHAVDKAMCEHVYVDPDSASASILVWQLVKQLVDEPPVESALCAFTGLMTDTGGFRYQNADTVAFEYAGELVRYGVDPSYVSSHVFLTRTLASLKLEALVIERMEILHDGDVALAWITAKDMEELGACKADTEPLVNTLRSLAGVRVACMLREQDGIVRGSLRSKDDTDVSALARELSGGGHKAAAGFTVRDSMDHARALLEKKLAALVASQAV